MTPGNYYATPELAAAYDTDSEGRRDLDFYLDLAAGLGAARIADIGAGTGLLCSLLAGEGHEVIGVEPERTMLSVAERQGHGASVSWLHGTAEKLPADWADLVLMTGHVAQYFLDDGAWATGAAQAARALRPGGRLAFEVRNPAAEAWRNWQTAGSRRTARGTVRTEVHRDGDLITHVDCWAQGARTWTTTETLRFPSRKDILRGLDSAGLTVDRTWGDWDHSPVNPKSPEWIFLTHPV
ncbi:class I SAM-dependent methyltransferase [Arthrobacter sp. zg-Y820]|uniref:class I SAM-dependent methyltransferase n=1 Tax=unclassified Arthrobacter TaxID=235627 RepID=UPI001E47653F|nr:MULTISPECIES: class I SAM-dependent methyltransferase [unclassified Arthrobacter]MCC9195644.1 class I SAM-dependent methyltransferase [Arthrobacter sp. zg-Y820]MDK1278503.1 class I SAM-dependent methyltransferase [Arthrobacter sp. zg.Y820]WIB09061.1 class I SAM-dependent methyltransferase [Arthrobacter sp. zg-Y820]